MAARWDLGQAVFPVDWWIDSAVTIDVSMNASGAFAIAYMTADGSGNRALRGSIYDANGQPTSGSFSLRSLSGGFDWVVALADDGVATYAYRPAPYATQIYARRFTSAGTPLGDEFPVNISTFASGPPEIAAAADGSFVVTWAA